MSLWTKVGDLRPQNSLDECASHLETYRIRRTRVSAKSECSMSIRWPHFIYPEGEGEKNYKRVDGRRAKRCWDVKNFKLGMIRDATLACTTRTRIVLAGGRQPTAVPPAVRGDGPHAVMRRKGHA